MKFGLFDHFDANDRPVSRQYAERIDFVAAAERAGFYCYHVAEHHATPLNMAPVPGIFLGALAQATSKIRLGPLGYLLPLYSPLRLIEEICILDQMSEGRLDVGVGRGISPFELKYHHVDPATSRGLFREALDVILTGLSNEVLDHQGENFSYTDVPMELRPLQKPHPPIWYPTTTPESAEFGGKNGYNFVTLGGVKFAKPTIDIFKNAYAKQDHSAIRINNDFPGGVAVGIMRHVVVAETDETATRIARHAYQGWEANLTKLWRLNNVPGPKIAEFVPPTLEDAERLGTVIVGSPARVRDILAQHIEALGLNYMVVGFYFGDMVHEHALQSMESFATDIMPGLNGL
jgi:alkanesulfonate monooxygenase SsuD/methylene tetrahydromethanopterin reductase-like flavin-dependent oxidoreductase (luciferase family)